MTIKEAIEKKAKLEQSILDLISKFEGESGLTLTEVKLQHATRFGSNQRLITSVETHAALP